MVAHTRLRRAHAQGVRIPRRHNFSWNGRETDGALAPDGTYYFRVALIHQGRTIELTGEPDHGQDRRRRTGGHEGLADR